jgi:hypothetical protein
MRRSIYAPGQLRHAGLPHVQLARQVGRPGTARQQDRGYCRLRPSGIDRYRAQGSFRTPAQASGCVQACLVLGYDEAFEAASLVAARGSACRAACDVGARLSDWRQLDRALPRRTPIHHLLGSKCIGQGAAPWLGEIPVVSGRPSLELGDSGEGLGTNRQRGASGALSARPSAALTRLFSQGSFRNTGPGESLVARVGVVCRCAPFWPVSVRALASLLPVVRSVTLCGGLLAKPMYFVGEHRPDKPF